MVLGRSLGYVSSDYPTDVLFLSTRGLYLLFYFKNQPNEPKKLPQFNSCFLYLSKEPSKLLNPSGRITVQLVAFRQLSNLQRISIEAVPIKHSNIDITSPDSQTAFLC